MCVKVVELSTPGGGEEGCEGDSVETLSAGGPLLLHKQTHPTQHKESTQPTQHNNLTVATASDAVATVK